jgi:hypothetical protein
MNFNACKVGWLAILCCAACTYRHDATAAESTMARTNSEITAEPPGLRRAVKASLEWWQPRAAGFPEFQVSPPMAAWQMMKEPLAKNDATTYSVLSEDGKDAWFAMVRSDRPNYWEISMPTRELHGSLQCRC